MKNTLITVVLGLSIGSLSAQGVPTVSPEPCPYFGSELLKVLALSPDQCGRIATIHQESWPTLLPIDDRLGVLTNSINYLSWTEDGTAEEVAMKIGQVIIERRKVLDEMRRLQTEKNQKVLGVLSAKQRQMIDQLVALAPAIRIFNDAVSSGLIPFDAVYPRGSGGPKGSSVDRLR